jgi:predicted N-formylglutamate amidohydrolase
MISYRHLTRLTRVSPVAEALRLDAQLVEQGRSRAVNLFKRPCWHCDREVLDLEDGACISCRVQLAEQMRARERRKAK